MFDRTTVKVEWSKQEKKEAKTLYYKDLADGDIYMYEEDIDEENPCVYIKDAVNDAQFNVGISYSDSPACEEPVIPLKGKFVVERPE